jgi:hypothetical protein
MRLAVVGILVAATGACTTADVLRVDPTPRPMVIGSTVPVLLDEPEEEYDSIALVEVKGSWGASLERMGRRLAAEAAKLGGDAVLITRRSSHSSSTLLPIGDSFVALDEESSQLIGKVIVYRNIRPSADPSHGGPGGPGGG